MSTAHRFVRSVIQRRAHRTRATVPLAGKQEAIVKRGKCERTTAWTKSQVLALRWLVRAVFTWPIVTYNDQSQQPIYWTNQILQQIRVGDVKCEKSCAAKSTTDFGLAPDWLKNWCEGFLNNCLLKFKNAKRKQIRSGKKQKHVSDVVG